MLRYFWEVENVLNSTDDYTECCLLYFEVLASLKSSIDFLAKVKIKIDNEKAMNPIRIQCNHVAELEIFSFFISFLISDIFIFSLLSSKTLSLHWLPL